MTCKVCAAKAVFRKRQHSVDPYGRRECESCVSDDQDGGRITFTVDKVNIPPI